MLSNLLILISLGLLVSGVLLSLLTLAGSGRGWLVLAAAFSLHGLAFLGIALRSRRRCRIKPGR